MRTELNALQIAAHALAEEVRLHAQRGGVLLRERDGVPDAFNAHETAKALLVALRARQAEHAHAAVEVDEVARVVEVREIAGANGLDEFVADFRIHLIKAVRRHLEPETRRLFRERHPRRRIPEPPLDAVHGREAHGHRLRLGGGTPDGLRALRQQREHARPDLRQRLVDLLTDERIFRHVHHLVREFLAVAQNPLAGHALHMVCRLVPVMLAAPRHHFHVRIRKTDFLEEVSELILLVAEFRRVVDAGVHHAGNRRARLDPIRRTLEDFHATRPNEVLFLFRQFGADRLARERSRHEHHPSVSKPPQSIPAVNVLLDLQRYRHRLPLANP